MSENILVSVIVPVYNSKKFLEACLDSIVNQSYKNLEILLIDDGSNDGSADILDLYSTKDDRIRVIHNLNYGVSYSRNYGLKIASGSKVLFIDSDDTVNLDYVNKLIESLKKEDKDLVICGINDVNVKKNKIKERKFPKNLSGNLREDFCALFTMPIITGPVAKLYDIRIIRENNILFSEDISFNEDVMFNLLYLRFVEKYKIIDEPLYSYYHRASMSLSKNRSERNFSSVLKVAWELRMFINDKNIIGGDIALVHQCLNYLKWFAISDGGFTAFKERFAKIRAILDGIYTINVKRRVLNVWLLKNDMAGALYVNYYLREKMKW